MTAVHLTVDVGVFMSAYQLGASEHYVPSHRLLRTIELAGDDCIKVIFDDEGMIEFQYRSKLGTLGAKLLQLLAAQGKLWSVHRARLHSGIRAVLLSQLHLDPEDFQYYVRTAAADYQGLLVSHDPHYSAAVCSALRSRLRVRVVDSEDAADRIDDECAQQEQTKQD